MSADVLVRRSVPGTAAPPGRRAWRPTPYQMAGLLFWLVMSLANWRVPLCCDAGQHAAVVERLKADLLHPRLPMADLPGAGSPYYSPYAVAQGVFARLTGLSGWQVLRLAGPLNLLVLLTGLGRFVRVLTPRPWAPVLALASMTLLWGTERAWWSGWLGLMSMTGNLGYPSAFATGLALWAWALTATRARDTAPVRFVGPSGLRGRTGYATLGALYGLILLVHPITAVAAGAGALACVCGWQRGRSAGVAGRWVRASVGRSGRGGVAGAGRWVRASAHHLRADGGGGPGAGRWMLVAGWGAPVVARWALVVARCMPVVGRWVRASEGHRVRADGGGGPGAGRWMLVAGQWAPIVARWALAGVGALCVARSWPYFDVFALAGDGRLDGMHHTLYRDLGGQFWLALLGLPALWLRVRRSSWRDPLALMFLLDCLVVGYGWVSGHYTYGRLLGLTLLGPQLALAVELAAARPWGAGRRLLAMLAATGACVGFLSVQAGAVVPRSLDPVGFAQPPRWPSYTWAARHIGRGEVVVADGYYAVRALAGYGPDLVAPAWPDAALDEGERSRRVADVHAYLDPAATRAERTAVARRYHVRWVLLTRRQKVPEEAVVVARSRRTGEVLARVG